MRELIGTGEKTMKSSTSTGADGLSGLRAAITGEAFFAAGSGAAAAASRMAPEDLRTMWPRYLMEEGKIKDAAANVSFQECTLGCRHLATYAAWMLVAASSWMVATGRPP